MILLLVLLMLLWLGLPRVMYCPLCYVSLVVARRAGSNRVCCLLCGGLFNRVQMLNLTHDWLRSFLPHVLTKINRVSFGLLTPVDLERALEV